LHDNSTGLKTLPGHREHRQSAYGSTAEEQRQRVLDGRSEGSKQQRGRLHQEWHQEVE